MSEHGVRALPFGDAAVLLQVLDEDDALVERLVLSLTDATERLRERDPRFGRPVPGFASVLVPVDPLDPGVERAVSLLGEVAADVPPPDPEARPQTGPLVTVATRYGGSDGPDLDAVAERHGLRAGDVVALHASTEYRVRFLGFVPGFAYLGRLPAAIATPRLDTPRERVPAGSVAIAGEQTAVYPSDTPGGWQLIGRTALRVWDPRAASPSLLLPGTRVRFEPAR